MAVSGSIDVAWRERRGRTARVLALPDEDLLALDPSAAPRYAAFSPAFAAAADRRGGAHRRLPLRGRLPRAAARAARPAGGPPRRRPTRGDPARRGGRDRRLAPRDAVRPGGLERARSLTAAGVPVVSGMALGIDSAAHLGRSKQQGSAPPVAVLAGGAETAYPARMRHLHARLIAAGAVVSEMPPGFGGHRWCFPARNRIIAALSTLTIVVEAATRPARSSPPTSPPTSAAPSPPCPARSRRAPPRARTSCSTPARR